MGQIFQNIIRWIKHKLHLCEYGWCCHRGEKYILPDAVICEKTGCYVDKWFYICFNHAKSIGFCASCGTFYGGCEDFDFNGSKFFCSDCLDELNHEIGLDDEDEMGSDEGYDYIDEMIDEEFKDIGSEDED
jgi:hypothetical protein